MPSLPIVKAGARFGPWLVIRWKRPGWECRHDDGRTAVLGATALYASVENLVGARFGELTVLAHIHGRLWLCECSCGRQVKRRSDRLAGGRSLICKRGSHGPAKSNKIEHRAWLTALHSGVPVEAEWRRDFAAFLRDVGKKPHPASSLCRRDTKAGWTRENTCWTKPGQTSGPKSPGRRTRFLEVAGQTKSLAEWARAYGISDRVVRARLRLGWPVDRALGEPVNTRTRR